MPSKKKSVPVPWDLKEGDDNYLKEPWILKKGKEFITIETNNNNRGNFYLQKDDEKRLSLSALQAKLTYHQLIEFGYKLQKTKSCLLYTSPSPRDRTRSRMPSAA